MNMAIECDLEYESTGLIRDLNEIITIYLLVPNFRFAKHVIFDVNTALILHHIFPTHSFLCRTSNNGYVIGRGRCRTCTVSKLWAVSFDCG